MCRMVGVGAGRAELVYDHSENKIISGRCNPSIPLVIIAWTRAREPKASWERTQSAHQLLIPRMITHGREPELVLVGLRGGRVSIISPNFKKTGPSNSLD